MSAGNVMIVCKSQFDLHAVYATVLSLSLSRCFAPWVLNEWHDASTRPSIIPRKRRRSRSQDWLSACESRSAQIKKRRQGSSPVSLGTSVPVFSSNAMFSCCSNSSVQSGSRDVRSAEKQVVGTKLPVILPPKTANEGEEGVAKAETHGKPESLGSAAEGSGPRASSSAVTTTSQLMVAGSKYRSDASRAPSKFPAAPKSLLKQIPADSNVLRRGVKIAGVQPALLSGAKQSLTAKQSNPQHSDKRPDKPRPEGKVRSGRNSDKQLCKRPLEKTQGTMPVGRERVCRSGKPSVDASQQTVSRRKVGPVSGVVCPTLARGVATGRTKDDKPSEGVCCSDDVHKSTTASQPQCSKEVKVSNSRSHSQSSRRYAGALPERRMRKDTGKPQSTDDKCTKPVDSRVSGGRSKFLECCDDPVPPSSSGLTVCKEVKGGGAHHTSPDSAEEKAEEEVNVCDHDAEVFKLSQMGERTRKLVSQWCFAQQWMLSAQAGQSDAKGPSDPVPWAMQSWHVRITQQTAGTKALLFARNCESVYAPAVLSGVASMLESEYALSTMPGFMRSWFRASELIDRGGSSDLPREQQLYRHFAEATYMQGPQRPPLVGCSVTGLCAELPKVLDFALEGTNEVLPEDGDDITPFHSVTKPSMLPSTYVARVVRYIRCSPEAVLLAVLYMERIVARHADFPIDSLTFHRLILTAIMVAAKFQDDRICTNKVYALVGGLSCRELNALEREFLRLLDYRLWVTLEEFVSTAAVVSLTLDVAQTVERRKLEAQSRVHDKENVPPSGQRENVSGCRSSLRSGQSFPVNTGDKPQRVVSTNRSAGYRPSKQEDAYVTNVPRRPLSRQSTAPVLPAVSHNSEGIRGRRGAISRSRGHVRREFSKRRAFR